MPAVSGPTIAHMPQITIPAVRTSPPLLSVSESLLRWVREPVAEAVAKDSSVWPAEHLAAAQWLVWAHGIGPLLYRLLTKAEGLDPLPGTLRTYLGEQFRLNGERVARILEELAAILRAAAEAGLAVMPLKGCLLATAYYDQSALRPMGDIDLLVRPGEESALERVLDSLGYERTRESWRHREFAAHGDTPGEFSEGEHPENPRPIEVHTAVRECWWVTECDISESLWADSRPGQVNGAPAVVPGRPGLFHHLLVHCGAQIPRASVRAIQLWDIALVGSLLEEREWSALLAWAEETHEERLLYAPLLLAGRFAGWNAPEAVVTRLARGTPRFLRALLSRVPITRLTRCDPHRSPVSPALAWLRPGREWLAPIKYGLRPPQRRSTASTAQRIGGYTAHWRRMARYIARTFR